MTALEVLWRVLLIVLAFLLIVALARYLGWVA